MGVEQVAFTPIEVRKTQPSDDKGWQRQFVQCVRATSEELHSALRRRDLPNVAYVCLVLAIMNRKPAKHGKSQSSRGTFSPWIGRLHVVQSGQDGQNYDQQGMSPAAA